MVRFERAGSGFAWVLMAGGLAAALLACGDDAPGPHPRMDRSAVEQLEALGYLEFTEAPAEGEGGVIVKDTTRSHPGFNLYAKGPGGVVELIDVEGEVVRRWKSPQVPIVTIVHLLPNGDLLAIGREKLPMEETERRIGQEAEATVLHRFSWDGELIWHKQLPIHHDVQAAPGGRITTLTRRYRHIPALHADIIVEDNGIAILSPDGEILEELSLYDVLSASPDFEFKLRDPVERAEEEMLDLLHTNSVEWMGRAGLEGRHPLYDPSNVMVSMRHQDSVAVIDFDRRELLWSWGQGELSGQHDARVLPNGHVLVFDNGMRSAQSRVVEVDPLTDEIVWEYRAPTPEDFFSWCCGSSQRLPNGNTLICDTTKGLAFEVSTDGEVVWAFARHEKDAKERRATMYRMKRFPAALVQGLLARSSPDVSE